MEHVTQQKQPIDYDARPRSSIKSYFNFRIIVFAAVVLSILAMPVYRYIDYQLSHGIKAGSDGYIRVDLKALSTFPFDQSAGSIEDVPERFRKLDGKKVVVVGEMYAPNASGPQVSNFDLVYSISKCCNTGSPQIQHFVKSHAVDGAIPYFGYPVEVRGTLRVDVTRNDGRITGVYHLAVESVEPA